MVLPWHAPLYFVKQYQHILSGSFLQIRKQLIHIGVPLYRRGLRDPFRLQHGSDRFLVGLIQIDLKGNTA